MDTIAEIAVLLVVVGFAVAVALTCLVCERPCRSCRRGGQHRARAGIR